MTILRIIGIAGLLLELTTFVSWALNDGFDRDFPEVFWKVLKLVSIITIAACVLVVCVVLAIDPEEIVSLFGA